MSLRRFLPWIVGLIALAAVFQVFFRVAEAAQAISSPTTVYSSNGCTVKEYRASTISSSPNRIITLPGGNHWLSEFRETPSRIAVIYPNRTIVQYHIPTPDGFADGIALGRDGAIWFTEPAASKIGRLSKRGVFTEYPLPPVSLNVGTRTPTGIVIGPDNNMWFTEANVGSIGRMSLTGDLTEFRRAGVSPSYITVGSDGALWFSDLASDLVGRITTTGKITEFRLQPKSAPMGITSGPDGALWFAESGTGKIGRITTSGVISQFNLPRGRLEPLPTEIASNGKTLWFTDPESSRIGQITQAGHITEVTLHPDVGPWGIAVDADGTAWFTERNANRIGVSKCP